MGRSFLKITLSKILSLLFFFFIVIVVNIISFISGSSMIRTGTSFLNRNILILVLMAILFMIGEYFLTMKFPLDLPAPVFNALGSLLTVTFVLRLFVFIDLVFNISIFSWIESLSKLLYTLVPLIVLLVGYISILMNKK